MKRATVPGRCGLGSGGLEDATLYASALSVAVIAEIELFGRLALKEIRDSVRVVKDQIDLLRGR